MWKFPQAENGTETEEQTVNWRGKKIGKERFKKGKTNRNKITDKSNAKKYDSPFEAQTAENIEQL